METRINQYPVVAAVTCFHGRYRNVKRIIRHFLDQTYEGKHYLLLYNNAKVEQALSNIETPSNKIIILVNNHIDSKTGVEYTNTGNIFRDAVESLPIDTKIVCWMDSDDSFLPSHLEEGVKGMEKAYTSNCLAYKPYNSYFLYENKCRLLHNTLEPSVFVDYQYIKSTGFHPNTVSYHQKWLDPLVANKQILVDKDGVPTLMYNWEEGHGNHKISGMGDTDVNFEAHRKWERDYGNKILTPASELEVQKYYTLAKGTRLETT